jgi:Ni2+-binding GTPase involved in maturation of urease and hydrogenase
VEKVAKYKNAIQRIKATKITSTDKSEMAFRMELLNLNERTHRQRKYADELEKINQEKNFYDDQHEKTYTTCRTISINSKKQIVFTLHLMRVKIYEGALATLSDGKHEIDVVISQIIIIDAKTWVTTKLLSDRMELDLTKIIQFRTKNSSARFHFQKYALKKFFMNLNDCKSFMFPDEIQKKLLLEDIRPIKQKKFITNQEFKIISANKFTVIVGPAGAGKSEILINIVKNVKANEKILIIADQNSVCDNIIKRILQIDPSNNKKYFRLNSDCHRMLIDDENLKNLCMENDIDNKLRNYEYFNVLECFQYRVYKQMMKIAMDLKAYSIIKMKMQNFLKECMQQMISHEDAKIIVTTVSSTTKLPNKTQFDIVLIDEVGCMSNANIFCVATKIKPTGKLVIFGDPNQIGNCRIKGNGMSLLQRLVCKKDESILWLNTQFRLTKELSNVLYEIFYDIDLSSIKVAEKDAKYSLLPSSKNIVLYTHSVEETQLENFEETEINSVSNSYINTKEGEIIREIMKGLPKVMNDPAVLQNTAILTAYAGQKYYLQGIIPTKNIYTIDQFQGMESKIVILSLVRQNDNKEIGFLRDIRRICSAFSRASNVIYIIAGSMFLEDDMPNHIVKFMKKIL